MAFLQNPMQAILRSRTLHCLTQLSLFGDYHTQPVASAWNKTRPAVPTSCLQLVHHKSTASYLDLSFAVLPSFLSPQTQNRNRSNLPRNCLCSGLHTLCMFVVFRNSELSKSITTLDKGEDPGRHGRYRGYHQTELLSVPFR